MSTAAEFDTYTPCPHYECTRGGVYHIGIKTDKEGNTSETPPVWLSDPIRLIGRGTDGTGSHYRIIEWKDRLTGAAKQAAIPSAEIGSVQGWQRLQSYGLTILSGRAKRERLADYLQTEGENTHYAVTARAGWHGLHPAQRRSHPPRQRRSGARDIQRRQKPSPRLRSGGNGAGMERRNRAIPHRQQPPMPCRGNSPSRAPNRAAGHGSGRLPPVRRFEGRQIHRRPHCLEHMGQPRRPDADLDGNKPRFQQPSQRPQRRPIGTGRNRAGQRPPSIPNRLFSH